MKFNEDSRVKIPAIVHLTRLGYEYIPHVRWKYHAETNIFEEYFAKGISKINSKDYTREQINGFIKEISVQLENTDLGKKFYESITGSFECKLIDLDHFDNNLFHVVTELTYKNEEEEFRPDITILINGMPLIFIEVKKPNNREGILAERNRINARFANPMFKKFMNITQLLVFSNNNEYDDDSVEPVLGAFYGTPNTEKVQFNPFREEYPEIIQHVPDEKKEVEKQILLDNNLVSVLGSNEYNTNKDRNTPTNRILSSLLSRNRLKFILKYGFTFVAGSDKAGSRIERHIMRYPQLFATFEIEKTLKKGIKKGIIWHTQGSGKTALAFFNVFALRDYYQQKKTIAKFYFIVDRLDLATQAKNEFESRGLKVEVVNSKDDFICNIRTSGVTAMNTGAQTITVVNIQKFSAESLSTASDYGLNVQRIYFLDEVHRSYKPTGSFLSNLIASDRDAVMIGLTGTPLISGEYRSRDVFGNYIHKYYYNKSIADGYTLKLIREGIETKFKDSINEVIKQIETKQGSLDSSMVFSHLSFVKPFVAYILNDFIKCRRLHNDDSIGAMIVCGSSEQARKIFDEINAYNDEQKKASETELKYHMAADGERVYLHPDHQPLSSALILHDVDTKQIRKDKQTEFKQGQIDILVVYNMLLTGFDSKRLKKLYLARLVKEHNLLQTLTRVNRPYKNFRYGYVVDFADIKREFDKTNREYFKELQDEIGDEFKNYTNLFKSQEEIDQEIEVIKEKLFLYDFTNLEEFQRAISRINDKKEVLELQKALQSLKELYNIIKVLGYFDLLEKFNFDKVNQLHSEVTNRLNIINLKENLENASDNSNLLNIALDKVQFTFRKIEEHELKIADKFRMELERTRKELERNFDKKDPVFVSLFEELKRVFKKKNIEELTSAEMDVATKILTDIWKRANDLNNKDALLARKYNNDYKYAKTHKRISENNMNVLKSEMALHDALMMIKTRIDSMVYDNHAILKNRDYFLESAKTIVMDVFESKGIRDLEFTRFINKTIVNEYLEEIREIAA